MTLSFFGFLMFQARFRAWVLLPHPPTLHSCPRPQLLPAPRNMPSSFPGPRGGLPPFWLRLLPFCVRLGRGRGH
eukprot:4999918-Alexandrium_andersonii.AAC.1